MIVSRFAIVSEYLVICCYQITKIFSTRYGFAIASSAWGPCNFGPSTDLAISVFREMSFSHSAYPNPHVSLLSAPKKLHEKNWRESLLVMNFIIHQIFLEFLQPFRDLRIQRVTPFYRRFFFICFWCFIGLGFVRLP